jgi:isopentenyl-diphosphate delta-isomerase type 1
MPLITYVDENDNVIGAGTGKEAREKGIYHRISRIFLFNSKGDLLIQKRADNANTLPGRWDQSAAGHVDEGEDYLTAAKRELEEEVGVRGIKLTEKGKFFTDEKDQPGKIVKRFNMLYTANYNEDIKPNPEEVSEVRWISLEELNLWMKEQPNDFTEGFVSNFRNLLAQS